MKWCWYLLYCTDISMRRAYKYTARIPNVALWICDCKHDGVIKWKCFPRYWPFVQGIHRSPVNSLRKSQWRGALMFSLICAWINLSKQSWSWWFETLSRSLWRLCNECFFHDRSVYFLTHCDFVITYGVRDVTLVQVIGLSHVRHQDITCTKVTLLLSIRSSGINFNQNTRLSVINMSLKMCYFIQDAIYWSSCNQGFLLLI